MYFLRFGYIPLRVYGNLNLPPVDVLLLQQKEFFPFLDQIRKNCVFIVMNIFEHQLISDSFCLLNVFQSIETAVVICHCLAPDTE